MSAVLGALLKCLGCGKVLPPFGAGYCGDCAKARVFPPPPMCPTCKKGLNYDPNGPMARFNPPHECKR